MVRCANLSQANIIMAQIMNGKYKAGDCNIRANTKRITKSSKRASLIHRLKNIENRSESLIRDD